MSATYDEIEEAFDNGDLDTTYPPSVYEAYCDYTEIDIDELKDDYREHASKIEDNYIGQYESHEQFLTEGLDIDIQTTFPYLVIDWDQSWESNYRHEFFASNGHYFHMF